MTLALSKAVAKRVSVCGEFNDWSPTATPMKRHDDGHWDITLSLSPGQYQYKFLIDGEWMPDPAAQKSVPNQYGSLNSVLEVRACPLRASQNVRCGAAHLEHNPAIRPELLVQL